jgi:hypothetical protein
LPDAIIPDPEDFETRLESAGVDPESFALRDSGAFYDWLADHNEWAEWSDYGLSHEAIAGMYAAGMEADDVWDHLTIIADGDDWSVEITTTDGNTYTIDLSGGFDIAWDYYDYADFYDVEIDKDIDTGEASE